MPGFQRIQPIGEGTIRGPARVLVAPYTVAFPTQLANMIETQATGSYVAEVQTITLTGTATAGTFTLAFQSISTAPIAYNATAATVATALNLVSSISSQGGVTVTGGPLATAPLVVTFGTNGKQPLIVPPVTGNLLVGTLPVLSVAETTPGLAQYDITPGSGWFDLGSTRSGVNVTRNNTEDQLDIDQIYSSILGVPNEWEMTVATQMAETTLENIALAWECDDAITANVVLTPNERTLPFGSPTAYNNRKLAVLHQKTIGPAAGLIRAVVFRSVTRSPQNSALDYQKTGQMQTIAQTWRAYADWTITDQNAQMGAIIEQEIA